MSDDWRDLPLTIGGQHVEFGKRVLEYPNGVRAYNRYMRNFANPVDLAKSSCGEILDIPYAGIATFALWFYVLENMGFDIAWKGSMNHDKTFMRYYDEYTRFDKERGQEQVSKESVCPHGYTVQDGLHPDDQRCGQYDNPTMGHIKTAHLLRELMKRARHLEIPAMIDHCATMIDHLPYEVLKYRPVDGSDSMGVHTGTKQG